MKLYASQIDSYLRESENLVLSCKRLEDEGNGIYGLILDDSCLYAEGGGQPWDLGYIDNNEVIRVEIVSDGLQVVIKSNHEYLSGTTVLCKVDWTRRYDFMQQHTCQHLLSASVHSLFGAETVKWELGRGNVAVDFARTNDFSSQEIESIEECVNEKIRNGHIVSWSVNTRDSLDSLELLRGAPKGVAAEFNQLRIITIDGYDANPCGGTHLHSTSEIQLFKVIAQEKDRGAIRLRFLCGNRVIRTLASCLFNEMELTRLLCIQSSEIVSTVTNMTQEKKELNKQLKSTQDDLSLHWGQTLVTSFSQQSSENSRRYIIQHKPGASLSFLQATGDVILQLNELKSLGIQGIYLSGSEENGNPATAGNALNAGNKKKKGKGPATSFSDPTEYVLVVPPSLQSGPFIFYSPTPAVVDSLKERVSLIVQGKAGGRPGKLQGQGTALENIVAIDELFQQTLNSTAP